jgi:hypothetical protein
MILRNRKLPRKNIMVVEERKNEKVHETPSIPSENFSIISTIRNRTNFKQLALNKIDSSLLFNPIPAVNMYINIVKKAKRKNENENENEKRRVPMWFDSNFYLNTYSDLIDNGIKTQEDAYHHWILHGEKENRECMKNHSLFKQYPALFNKYLLGLSNSETPINYEIVYNKNTTKKYICSIHCYDLNNFNSFFGIYLNRIEKFFDLIVTYVKDPLGVSSQYEYTFIRIENKGMDLGSKFVTADFLKNKRIDYSYVFFIHSKTKDFFRKRYISPFLTNLYDIIKLMEEKTTEAIFNGEIYSDENWGRNSVYMDEIIPYLNMDSKRFEFPAGNFYIISKDICESLFSDLKLYNVLNAFDSFDYSWVKSFYNLTGDYKTVYDNYLRNNLFGNNLETTLGHSGLADCMIEHVFERLMFLICFRDNKKFFICDKTKGKNIFNKLELTISVMACHSENSTKVNTIVNNVHYLSSISDIVYIIDTDSFKNNNLIQSLQDSYPDACINNELTDTKALEYINDNPDLSEMTIEEAKNHFKVFGYKEPNRLHIFTFFIFVFYCENHGYCYGKWLHFYKNVANETKYKNYILTNDSFLITRPLNEFASLINSNQYDLISLTASNEISYHYTDFLRNYNSNSIETYINFIKTQLSLYENFLDVIEFIEVPSVHLFSSRRCIYDAEEDCRKNVHFDDTKIMHYLNDLNYPIVKIKKIGVPYYDMFNIPSDFDPDEYIELYPDLENVNDVRGHFLNDGMREQRYYKKHQRIYIYPPLKEYLLEYSSKHSGICKIDFENYTA